MKYFCELCNYNTHDKSNYNRHLRTKIHTTKLDVSGYTRNDQAHGRKQRYICDSCGAKFKYTSGLYRHRKARCNNNNTSTTNNNLNITQLINVITELNENLKVSKSNTVNYITVKYIQQNFLMAPPLDKLQDYADKFNDTLAIEELDNSSNSSNSSITSTSSNNNNSNNKHDSRLMEQLIFNFKSNTLHKYLGDFIIKYYKKDEPSQQSIWNTDTSRLNYFIKELITNNETNWTKDSKGIKTKNYIIIPLLEYINAYVTNSYNYLNKKLVKEHSIKKCNIIAKDMQSLQEITKCINNNNVLTDQIIRYIAPYFDIKQYTKKLIN